LCVILIISIVVDVNHSYLVCLALIVAVAAAGAHLLSPRARGAALVVLLVLFIPCLAVV
jgi:hypothetical protein